MERDMAQTTVCIGGCGFYGNAATEGYCSKCFKDTLKRKLDPQRLSPTGATVSPQAGMMATSVDHHACTSTSTTQTPSSLSGGGVQTLSPNSMNASQPMAVPHATDTTQTTSLSANVLNANNPVLTGVCSTSSFESMQSDDSTQAVMSSSAPGSHPMAVGLKKKNRCHGCNKKVGLTGFTCRCGGLFCSEHRYSDSHECSFDYKALGAAEIRKNNPLVVGDKIEKL